mmetsp:Transcript_7677/g.28285  ORF Transcript_7677/g.28285 Transcript_7677/m.28285 type:complete len:236 (+) Transcript_7677:1675-2382(+)
MKKVTDFSLPSYIEMYNATLDVSESERKACIIEAECILRGGKLSSAISSPAKLSTVIVYDESSAMTPAQSQLRYPYVARCLGDAKLMRLFIREVMRVVNDGGFAAALAMCADLDFIAGSLWTLFQIGGIAVIFLPLLFRRLCDDSCIGARSPSTLEAVCLFLSRGAVSSFSGTLVAVMPDLKLLEPADMVCAHPGQVGCWSSCILYSTCDMACSLWAVSWTVLALDWYSPGVLLS